MIINNKQRRNEYRRNKSRTGTKSVSFPTSQQHTQQITPYWQTTMMYSLAVLLYSDTLLTPTRFITYHSTGCFVVQIKPSKHTPTPTPTHTNTDTHPHKLHRHTWWDTHVSIPIVWSIIVIRIKPSKLQWCTALLYCSTQRLYSHLTTRLII